MSEFENNESKARATVSFRDGFLSLSQAARLARMPLASFIAHVSSQGIPVVAYDAADVERDSATLDQWFVNK